MVHGMSQDHRVFSEQIEAFQDRYRLLLIDLPGHGLAGDLPGPYGHGEFAEHVLNEIAAAGIERLHYWGTHTGATVGLLVAASAPARFHSLVLEGPGMPGESPAIVTRILANMRKIAVSNGMTEALRVWWEKSCWFEAMRADPLGCRAEAHREIVRDFGGAPWLDTQSGKPLPNVGKSLARIACPALVYVGEDDHPDFHAAADQTAALLPNACQRRIPGTGGFPAWEKPQTVNNVVDAFFQHVDLGLPSYGTLDA